MRPPILLSAVALLTGVGCPRDAFAQKRWVIALSNSFYGNTWRRQMVDAFKEAADQAKKEGRIADYMIENGDGSVNQQVSQMNGLINSAPGIGGAAFWLTLDILNGANAPKKLTMPPAKVTAENLSQYTDLPPGSIVSPQYTEDWVKDNLLKAK